MAFVISISDTQRRCEQTYLTNRLKQGNAERKNTKNTTPYFSVHVLCLSVCVIVRFRIAEKNKCGAHRSRGQQNVYILFVPLYASSFDICDFETS